MESPDTRKALAFLKRELSITFKDRGAFVERLVMPFFLILAWAMLVAVNLIPEDAAEMLLAIQMVWIFSSKFQEYFNISFMSDIWSGEFGNLMSYMSIVDYISGKMAFSFVASMIMSVLIIATCIFGFGLSADMALKVAMSVPAIWLFSSSIGLIVSGLVLVLGRSYGFLSWTLMYAIVLLSFPFSIPSSLIWLKPLAEVFPLYYIFSFIRGSGSPGMAYLESLIWPVAAILIFSWFYRLSLKTGGIPRVSS